MLLARLRWSAFGLRGRIVGAVVVTAAISLGVAALVLLPRLEHSLRNASVKTLRNDLKTTQAISVMEEIAKIHYGLIVEARSQGKVPPGPRAQQLQTELGSALTDLGQRLGAETVKLMGSVDSQGHGTVVAGAGPGTGGDLGPTDDVANAYKDGNTQISLGVGQHVRAAVSMSQYNPAADSVVAVRSSIREIPLAADAVRSAFAIAALVAILLTLVLAIPLAAQLVRRLQRLRQAALQLAIGGNVADFPADRARDEVGDLARSFSIMQRRLRQQEEARRAFVATASHELRTPLASLDGMLELLADDLRAEDLDLDDAAALLGRARVQSRRLGRLAADLLDLSRIDADVRLRSEPIELSELGRAVLAEFELASTNRGVSARLEDDRQPAWAMADPGSVARILRILLDNALRVAPRGSQVTVAVRSRPEPTLIVSDQGPGVAPEERALIFERFKRGRETGGEAGFGLGLAIGRELAQRMGGSLVLADTDGPGATFTLRLQPTEAPSADRINGTAGV